MKVKKSYHVFLSVGVDVVSWGEFILTIKSMKGAIGNKGSLFMWCLCMLLYLELEDWLDKGGMWNNVFRTKVC